MNLFYAHEIHQPDFVLDVAESKHLLKVLRMKDGDTVHFTDGNGFFYECRIILASTYGCRLKVVNKRAGNDKRPFLLYMAVAPTKNINRFEWFLEKATEIGVDRIIPFTGSHSERKIIKTERLNRVITAAVKQSLKSYRPQLNETIKFDTVLDIPFDGQKFIANIHSDENLELVKAYKKGANSLILIGPEGDFSGEELEQARNKGFLPVRLGPSRLRTETAAVVACHTVNLLNY